MEFCSIVCVLSVQGRVLILPFHGLLTSTDRLLHRALDGVALRQRVTAHNIANAQTPGYKRFNLSFEENLRDAIQSSSQGRLSGVTTHPNHFRTGTAHDPLSRPFIPERARQTTMRNDGNNVDIEAEMAQVIKDQIHYNALAQEVAKRYTMIKDAITGRR